MNNFFGFKKSSKMLFHYKTMLHDVSLPVGIRVVGGKNGPISPLSPVGDFSLKTRVRYATICSTLPNRTTFKRAEFLSALSRIGNVFIACSAQINWCFAPSSRLFTRLGANSLLALRSTAIQWMKTFTAYFTNKRDGFISHFPSIAYKERYCEIAARRLSQEVFNFSVEEKVLDKTNEIF